MLETVWVAEMVELDSPAEARLRSSKWASREESTLADSRCPPGCCGVIVGCWPDLRLLSFRSSPRLSLLLVALEISYCTSHT